MLKFETGKTYSCRSLCDHECIWSFTVANRTEKTITTTEGKTFKVNTKLSEYNQAETVFPLGRYSMAPTLRAN